LEGVNVLVFVLLVWVYVLGLGYPVSVVLSGLLTLPTSENVVEVVVVIPPRVGGESKEDIVVLPVGVPLPLALPVDVPLVL
jgi:hypothetical protein